MRWEIQKLRSAGWYSLVMIRSRLYRMKSLSNYYLLALDWWDCIIFCEKVPLRKMFHERLSYFLDSWLVSPPLFSSFWKWGRREGGGFHQGAFEWWSLANAICERGIEIGAIQVEAIFPPAFDLLRLWHSLVVHICVFVSSFVDGSPPILLLLITWPVM